MHNRAIRYISMQPYRTRLNKLYAFSKLLKINELYQYSAMKFMFRLYNDREFKSCLLMTLCFIIKHVV